MMKSSHKGSGKQSVVLPSNHRRVLSAVARGIEEALRDIEERIMDQDASSGLHRIKQTLDGAQKQKLSEVIHDLWVGLDDFVKQFGLDHGQVTETQVLQAQYTRIWALLEDSRPEQLKGYGEVPEHLRAALGEAINRLSERLERLRTIWTTDE